MLFRRIRSVLFWVHLVLGVSAGLVILLMSVTGVLLGFERQTIAYFDGTPTVAVGTGAPRPVDELLAINGIASADVASVAMRRDPTIPVTVRFHERERAAVLIDPYTGALLPPQTPGKAAAFMSALRRWHRWIGAGTGELRTQMKAVTGAANLIFLFLVLSGLWLWWPRHWTRARLKATLVPSLGKAGKARDFNWHNSLGFWSAVPLALVVATGVFISYQWPGRWLDRALGSESEKAAAIAAARAAPAGAPSAGGSAAVGVASATPRDASAEAHPRAPIALSPLIATAQRAHPAWQSLTVTVPANPAPTIRVAVAEGNTYRPDLRTTLVLDRETAAPKESLGYAQLSTSRRIRAWVRFGHTGEVFGVTGQAIATLVTAIGALLVWTGFALAYRRLAAFLKRRARPAPADTDLPDVAGEPLTVG